MFIIHGFEFGLVVYYANIYLLNSIMQYLLVILTFFKHIFKQF